MGRGGNTSQASVVSSRSTGQLAGMQLEVYDRTRPLEDGALPDYENLLIELPRTLTAEEQEQFRALVCSWAFLPFVANGTTENRWLSGRHFWINASSYAAQSKDWRAREVFDLLATYSTEGTPIRKDGTRKWAGLALVPKRIILSHPGDRSPATPAEPLDRPTARPRAAQQLLGFRGR